MKEGKEGDASSKPRALKAMAGMIDSLHHACHGWEMQCCSCGFSWAMGVLLKLLV